MGPHPRVGVGQPGGMGGGGHGWSIVVTSHNGCEAMLLVRRDTAGHDLLVDGCISDCTPLAWSAVTDASIHQQVGRESGPRLGRVITQL